MSQHERMNKMKMKMKLMAGALASVLLIAGCSADKEEADTPKDETPVEQTTDQDKATTEIKQNEDLTKKIQDEKGVIDGQAYEQDGTAIGTLLLEKDVSDDDAKKLAERYADEIKKEYKDLPVNVQAVRDGENVANITLD